MSRGWVIDNEPSRRFPVHTRGNAGEVFPNVMTPLTGSPIDDASIDGQVQALGDLGLLVGADRAEPGDLGN